MLSREDNELLCRVGPGTPMGNLLREYWMPALPSSEFPGPDSAVVRMRLVGENLVMFRDSKGRVGALPESCPHRGASLYFGRNVQLLKAARACATRAKCPRTSTTPSSTGFAAPPSCSRKGRTGCARRRRSATRTTEDRSRTSFR